MPMRRPATAGSGRPSGGLSTMRRGLLTGIGAGGIRDAAGGSRAGSRPGSRASSASPRGTRPFSMATGQTAFGLIGVGGGIVGTLGERGSGSPRGGPPSHQMAAGQRARSASPRGGRRHASDAFSQPRDALSLAKTPASDRPVGLLGSVLRREAAIAAMKTAVQVAPPPPGRDRTKALRELAETIHELREATVDAVELLGARPKDQARFYWNGMDLVLKLLTDLQWGPFPQTVDPLLWKWFSYWSMIWTGEEKRSEPHAARPEIFAVAGDNTEFLVRCRRAERKLLEMAAGASTEGSGMGGWARQSLNDRVQTLRKVQMYRLSAAHSEGGANHAQRRRYANMEALLYGKEGVHVGHLKELAELTSETRNRAAWTIQRSWRYRFAMKNLDRKAKGLARKVSSVVGKGIDVELLYKGVTSPTGGEPVSPGNPARQPPQMPPRPLSPPREAPPREAPPRETPTGEAPSPLAKSGSASMAGSPEVLDRSYLREASMGLPPDMV